jgi:hypothetical protein
MVVEGRAEGKEGKEEGKEPKEGNEAVTAGVSEPVKVGAVGEVTPSGTEVEKSALPPKTVVIGGFQYSLADYDEPKVHTRIHTHTHTHMTHTHDTHADDTHAYAHK